ncbi:MAG TPA: hypothetical protein VFM55_06540 [Micromonosporaceae bacterium]|nr:hypothetical protein [Micromonosporaceae bacterium]
MKINVILADTGVQDPQGKLHLLGVGWSQIGVQPNGLSGDMAVAVLIEVPWDMCNKELNVELELRSEDGEPVLVPTPGGQQPLRMTQRLVIPTPPGAPNGSPGTANLLVKLQGGLALAPGSWYAWRVTADGKDDENWTARFFVRRQPSMPTFGAPPSGELEL